MNDFDLEEYKTFYCKGNEEIKNSYYLYKTNIELFSNFSSSINDVHTFQYSDTVYYPDEYYYDLCDILKNETISKQIEYFFKMVKVNEEEELKYGKTEYGKLYNKISNKIKDNLDNFEEIQKILIEEYYDFSNSEYEYFISVGDENDFDEDEFEEDEFEDRR